MSPQDLTDVYRLLGALASVVGIGVFFGVVVGFWLRGVMHDAAERSFARYEAQRASAAGDGSAGRSGAGAVPLGNTGTTKAAGA